MVPTRRLPSSTVMMYQARAGVRTMVICWIAVLLGLPLPAHAYAVLSHEAIIDAAWETHIKPLLLKKFPQATEQDLTRAHAYAYAAAILQRMSYHPYPRTVFSELTRY